MLRAGTRFRHRMERKTRRLSEGDECPSMLGYFQFTEPQLGSDTVWERASPVMSSTSPSPAPTGTGRRLDETLHTRRTAPHRSHAARVRWHWFRSKNWTGQTRRRYPEPAMFRDAAQPVAEADCFSEALDDSGVEFLLPHDFPPLRPVQADALGKIKEAHDIVRRENRLATAAVITPTSSGKDLLPLALARALKGTSVMFVPFTHLVESAVAYTRDIGGVAETFDTARVHAMSAADVVICSFEHAQTAVPLMRNLYSLHRLAGVIVNEAHVLDRSLVTFRDFECVSKMFGLLTQHKVAAVAVFMSATLRHSRKILEFCGLPGRLDSYLAMSPIRANVSFVFQLLKGSESFASHKAIMAAAFKLIDEHAPDKRVCLFVMYKWQMNLVVTSLKDVYPGRTIVEFDKVRRPDVTRLGQSDLVVATSALKTGANMSETNLVIAYGGCYSLEDLLQGAGRGGRFPGSQVIAFCGWLTATSAFCNVDYRALPPCCAHHTQCLMLSVFLKGMLQGMPESTRCAQSTFACYSPFAFYCSADPRYHQEAPCSFGSRLACSSVRSIKHCPAK
jgi:hypothetical protein